jgi:hypothetical protein
MECDGTRELRAFFFGSKCCLIFVGNEGVDAQVSNAASSSHFTEVGNPRRSHVDSESGHVS